MSKLTNWTGAGYIFLLFETWERITHIASCSKHVLSAKQRKSKPWVDLSEARRSEQGVFLACSEWSLRGCKVEYSIHTMRSPYAKCLPLRNVSWVLICKTKPAHSECQWGLCAPLSFPFPAMIWQISVFRCSRKRHLFGTLSSLNFHEETSVWKQLWDAIACTQPNDNHGHLPTMLLGIWHEKPPRWINPLRKRLYYKWVTSDWTGKLSDATLCPHLNWCVTTVMYEYCLLHVLQHFFSSNQFNEFQSYIMHAFNTGHLLGSCTLLLLQDILAHASFYGSSL